LGQVIYLGQVSCLSQVSYLGQVRCLGQVSYLGQVRCLVQVSSVGDWVLGYCKRIICLLLILIMVWFLLLPLVSSFCIKHLVQLKLLTNINNNKTNNNE